MATTAHVMARRISARARAQRVGHYELPALDLERDVVVVLDRVVGREREALVTEQRRVGAVEHGQLLAVARAVDLPALGHGLRERAHALISLQRVEARRVFEARLEGL